jgi:hypothetical protein
VSDCTFAKQGLTPEVNEVIFVGVLEELEMQDTETTKVVFRKFQGEIIALFPEEAFTLDPVLCSSYAHVGQHSAADYYGVLTSSKPATDAEAADLKAELESLGYNLKVYRRSPLDAYQKRKDQIRKYLDSAN